MEVEATRSEPEFESVEAALDRAAELTGESLIDGYLSSEHVTNKVVDGLRRDVFSPLIQ